MRILTCSNLVVDVTAADDARPVQAFAPVCLRMLTRIDELGAVQTGESVQLVGGACCSKVTAESLPPGSRVHHQEQCLYLFAPAPLVRHYQALGAYVVTPGWLAHWRENFARMGFDADTAREFLGPSLTRVVLLDTGVRADSAVRLEELAAALGLPHETVPVGLDHLRQVLSRLRLEKQLADERRQGAEALAQATRKLADHAMAEEVLRGLGLGMPENEVVDRLLDLCRILFVPRCLRYLSIVDGVPEAGEVGEAMRLFVEGSAGSWVLMPAGFMVRVGGVGVLEVDGIEYPEHRHRYLDLALALTGTWALAVDNARAYRKLAQSKDRLEEEMATRLALEARMRHAHKLEAVGLLAAGVAHEINTPAQAVCNNLEFLADGIRESGRIMSLYRATIERVAASAEDLLALRAAESEADFEYFTDNAAGAAEEALESVRRISTIVGSLRAFTDPRAPEMAPEELDAAIRAALELARKA